MKKTLILKITLQFLQQILLDLKEALKFTAVEIGDAASQGDLKENAEFEAAKEKEHLLLSKQLRIQNLLIHPVYIDIPTNPNTVSFGTYIEAFDVASQTTIKGVVAGVAEMEAGLFDVMCISYNSPICTAILGKQVGDEVPFKLVGKQTKLIIQKIESCQHYLKINPKLIIVGNIGRDEIFHDGKQVSSFIAGSAYYASVGASGVTSSVSPIAAIGHYDTELTKHLDSMGVMVQGLQRIANVESPKFEVYYNTSSEIRDLGREVIEHVGSGKFLSFNQIPNNLLMATHVMICCFEPAQQLEFIVNIRAKNTSIKMIGADSVEHHLQTQKATVMKVFEHADIIFVNARETVLVSELSEMNKYIVKKMGASGAELWKADKFITRVNAPEVQCVDATGSGDVLAGTFMALLALGKSYDQALEIAVARATDSVTQLGVQHILTNT